MNKDNTSRRNVLKVVGSSIAMAGISTPVVGKSESSEYDLGFNPSSEKEVNTFVENTRGLKPQVREDILSRLSEAQIKAVQEATTIENATLTVEKQDKQTISPSGVSAPGVKEHKAVITAYSGSGNKIWEFHNNVTVEVNSGNVVNLNSEGRPEDTAVSWQWISAYSPASTETIRSDNYNWRTFEEGAFQQCLAGGVPCVSQTYPWIEMTGTPYDYTVKKNDDL